MKLLSMYLLIGAIFNMVRIFVAVWYRGGIDMTTKGFLKFILIEVLFGMVIWPLSIVLWLKMVWMIFHSDSSRKKVEKMYHEVMNDLYEDNYEDEDESLT